MVTTVKTRPNHYEVLGLTPDATGDEIARAFAREVSMFRPQPLGGVAEAGIAYAVLRDPAKRRAYDDSLGLNQPPPAPEPPAPEPEKAIAPFVAHHMHALARPKPVAEPRTAAFIASALREPVEPEVRPEPQADLPQPAKPEPAKLQQPKMQPPTLQPPQLQPSTPKMPPMRMPVRILGAPAPEDQPIAWKQPAAVVAAIVGGVALIGAWAGWDAGNAIEQEPQPDHAVTVALPKAKAPEAAVAEAPAYISPRGIFAQPDRRPRSARIERAQAPQQPVAVAEETPRIPPPPAEVNPPEQEAVAEATPTPTAVAANMPLSNAAIARTIARIGYSCGRVASTSQILGNMYKVTCTSGDSYRAAPVGGRYRFKRL